MSLSPVLYSTPDGCAAIGDKGFDAVWAAVPGHPDPATIFAATFFPGAVAVQWGGALWNGVDYDVSTSQFSLTPGAVPDPPSNPQEITMRVVTGTNIPAGYQDPHGPGAVYITNGVSKRYIGSTTEAAADEVVLCGQTDVLPFDQGALDRIPELLPVVVPGSAQLDLGKLAALTTTAPVVDVNALATLVASALATHPLTETLTDVERDAIAAHVMAALRAQLAKA